MGVVLVELAELGVLAGALLFAGSPWGPTLGPGRSWGRVGPEVLWARGVPAPSGAARFALLCWASLGVAGQLAGVLGADRTGGTWGAPQLA